MGEIPGVSQTLVMPFEQAEETPVGIGKHGARKGNPFPSQAGGRQRHHEALRRFATGDEIPEPGVDDLSPRETQGRETRRTESGAHPAGEGGLPGYRFPVGGREAAGSGLTAPLPVALEPLADRFREFHAPSLCLGGKHFNYVTKLCNRNC
jgi:hypothetical protein